MTADPREVSQLRKRVAELEAVEERYRALLEDGNVAVFVTDLESTTYVEVNGEAVELLGYSEQELLHMGPADIAGEGTPASELLVDLRRTGSSSVRLNAKRADGTEIELQATTRLLHRGDKPLAHTVARDMADRTDSDLLMTVLNTTEDFLFFKDRSRRFVRASRSFEKLLGIKPGEIIGKRDADLFPPEMAASSLVDEREVIEEGRPVLIDLRRGTVTRGNG